MAGTKGKVGGRGVTAVEHTCETCGKTGPDVIPVKRCKSNGKGHMVKVCKDGNC